ncbi:XapX domain-containing protein [Natrialbaceae archaeon GCM10025810]|uniref:XapX domain-containing protein n=1 Tax=Halovalidus salilacus TaxID=3075124 RepID=UPI0036138A8E
MNAQLTLLAMVTGLLTGGLFRYLHVPIPAPPELPGLMGIVGIYVGYRIVDHLGLGFDLLDSLGL